MFSQGKQRHQWHFGLTGKEIETTNSGKNTTKRLSIFKFSADFALVDHTHTSTKELIRRALDYHPRDILSY